jgi:hypothetical protein
VPNPAQKCEAQIVSMQRETKLPYGDGWIAIVKYPAPLNTVMRFSRYDDEDVWLCDSRFINGLPDFVEGVGSRCCAKTAAHSRLAEKLDAMLEKCQAVLVNCKPGPRTPADTLAEFLDPKHDRVFPTRTYRYKTEVRGHDGSIVHAAGDIVPQVLLDGQWRDEDVVK